VRRSACLPAQRVLQAHAGPVVVQELDAALLQGRLHFKQGRRLRADGGVKGFHAPDRADGDARGFCKLRLIPSEKYARRPQLPAVGESQ
jgi:hypothetical protein